MKEELTNITDSRLANVASRAVGVEKSEEKRRWVIGIVLNNTETSTRDRLLDLGYEAYVPSQIEIRVWKNGRKKKSERIFFKNWVFLHATEAERKEVVNTPWIKEYYKDKGRNKNIDCPVLVIPDDQMEKMRFMLYNAETSVEISNYLFKKGDEIHVVRGKLSGLTGFVSEDNDGNCIIVIDLGLLGNAKVQVDRRDIALLEKTN